MIIELNGESYIVPRHIEQRIMDQMYSFLAEKLLMLDAPIRLGLKPISRHFLGKLEAEINKLGKDGKKVRPPNGADPTLHYARILLATYQEALKDAILHISTENSTATAFAFSIPKQRQGEGGRPMADSWNFGIGEDSSNKISGQSIGETLSTE